MEPSLSPVPALTVTPLSATWHLAEALRTSSRRRSSCQVEKRQDSSENPNAWLRAFVSQLLCTSGNTKTASSTIDCLWPLFTIGLFPGYLGCGIGAVLSFTAFEISDVATQRPGSEASSLCTSRISLLAQQCVCLSGNYRGRFQTLMFRKALTNSAPLYLHSTVETFFQLQHPTPRALNGVGYPGDDITPSVPSRRNTGWAGSNLSAFSREHSQNFKKAICWWELPQIHHKSSRAHHSACSSSVSYVWNARHRLIDSFDPCIRFPHVG